MSSEQGVIFGDPIKDSVPDEDEDMGCHNTKPAVSFRAIPVKQEPAEDEEGGKTVDAQGNADLWQWSISSDNKLIINEIFRSNGAWLGHIEGFFQPNGDEIFKLCIFEKVQVCGPVSDGMKEMAKEMPFPFELYDHLHDGRFGKLK